MDRLQELVRLHRMGTGAREVARILSMSPTTERTYRTALADEGLLAGAPEDVPLAEVLRAAVEKRLPLATPPQMVSSVDAVRERIVELAERGLKPQAIYDRLRLDDPTFAASFYAIRAAWRRWRKARGVRAEDVAIPVETAAGDIAQVDFGYVGKLYDPAIGRPRKAWVFVMVLAYSRRMVVRVCFDQKIETWLRVHVEAFRELGSAPRTLVPDNLKAAVVRAAFGVDGAASLNRSYRELARHYGFKVDPTPIYAPTKKGKVESGVKYVKRNFFAGRAGEDVADVAIALQRWVDEIANVRIHGTTHQRPNDLFVIERDALLPLPERRFEVVTWQQARVHQDSHIAFDKRLYSVPWRLIGQKVWLRATVKAIVVYDADDARVAMHDRRGRTVRSTCDEHLPADRAVATPQPRVLGGPRRPDLTGGGDLRARGLRLRRRALDAAHGAGHRHAPRKVSGDARDRGVPARAALRQLPVPDHQEHPTRRSRSDAVRDNHHHHVGGPALRADRQRAPSPRRGQER
jgi:transposase